jgi:phospholipid N-methyltransferase
MPAMPHAGTTARRRRSRPAPLLFFRKFLRHGRRVASFAPSSRPLAAALCDHVTPDRPQVIVELGAGTGAVTAVACERMHPESRLIAVEIDRQFCRELRRRCPRAEVLPIDVRSLPANLERLGVPRVDVMLNGLPTPSLPRPVNRVVLDAFARFASADAVFSQLTVMPWVYKPIYDRLFHEVTFRLVLRNVPPGGAYHCTGLREGYVDLVPGRDTDASRATAAEPR